MTTNKLEIPPGAEVAPIQPRYWGSLDMNEPKDRQWVLWDRKRDNVKVGSGASEDILDSLISMMNCAAEEAALNK